jgi:hypothetical protein
LPLTEPSSGLNSKSIEAGLDFSDGVGWIALALAILLAVISFLAWLARTVKKRREEASLVTSHYRLLGGLGVHFVYEISVHNGTPHPLRIVDVRYWDSHEWRPMLARSTATGDPVILPGDIGVATVPAMTTDLSEFDHFYYFSYTDSRSRTWFRRIDSPDFLTAGEVRKLTRFHGTV